MAFYLFMRNGSISLLILPTVIGFSKAATKPTAFVLDSIF
jgi:hypothetical protein